MGFFQKAMASLGVGGVKLNAVVENTTVRAGSQVSGYVNVQGGNVEQHIDNLNISVMTKYEEEVDDNKRYQNAKIQTINLNLNRTVLPKENFQVPFSFVLTLKSPISSHKTQVWLNSSLDIEKAFDPTDIDYLKVIPHPYMESTLAVIESLGFRLKEVKNEKIRVGTGLPFGQVFEFVPVSGIFKNNLDEIEVIFVHIENGLRLVMEIDRKSNNLSTFLQSAFDLDETKTELKLDKNTLESGSQAIAGELKKFISSYVK
jgi:sporulation-control protein